MSARRALVQCAVLSLQDSCVFYPCCVNCFSRIEAEEHDSARYRCSRCGYRCGDDQVQFRYRLSLKVSRDRSIFGVTVFGNSLNQFFGINASGLQKFVGTKSSRFALLQKAVKDCFIGRRFLFGIKLNGLQNEPSFEGLLANNFNLRNTSQFVASQIILPQTTSLAGFTVLKYYQNLLQKASELDLDCSQPNKIAATTLRLIPSQSPSSSFGNSTLFKSGLISQTLPGSRNQNDSFSSSTPWQQSLGLVTSSAEQDDENENNRQEGKDATSFLSDRDVLTSHKTSPVSHSSLSSELSIYDSPSFGEFSKSRARNIGSSFIKNTCCNPSHPARKSSGHSRTLSSSSLVWEDLPFSESLSEFLSEEDKKVHGEIRQDLKGSHQKKIKTTFWENPKSVSAWRNKVWTTSHNSQGSPDINKALPAGGDKEDLPEYVGETPVKPRNRQEFRKILSVKQNNKNDGASLRLEVDCHLEGEPYNCSADLFSDSSVSTEMFIMNPERSETTKNTLTPRWKLDRHHIDSGTDVSHMTPKQESRKTKTRTQNSLIQHDLEFVPSSQSTPVLKVHAAQESSFKNSTGSIKENRTQCIRRSHKPGPRRRSRRTKKHFKAIWDQTKLQKRNFNLELDETSNPGQESQASVVFWGEDDEVVAPTPAGKTEPSIAVRRRQHANVIQDTSYIECQEDRVGFKGTVLDHTLRSSQKDLTPKGDFTKETLFEDIPKESNVYLVGSENQSCEWSRDLFSDSI